MKLYYFDIYGRAEPIRLLLSHAKVDYEDVRFNHKEFQKLKESGIFEFGQVPVLEMNGKTYAQSQAILRMLGKMYGYYPSDPEQSWKVDSILDANRDIQEKYWEMQLAKGDRQNELKQDYIDKHLSDYFRILQKRLLQNTTQKYMVGNKMTIADFDNAHVAYDYFLNPKNQFYTEQRDKLQNYDDLYKYYVSLHTEMKDYFAKRPINKPY